MRAFRVGVCAFIAVFVLTACFPSPEEGGAGGAGGSTVSVPVMTPKPSGPEVGTVAYDANLCEMVYTGTGPVQNGWDYYRGIDGITYCYKQIGQEYVYDAYKLVDLLAARMDHSRIRPAFRRDFSNGSGGYQLDTLVVMSYLDNVWRRTPLKGTQRYIEVWYNNKWIPARDYEAIQSQLAAQKSAQQRQQEAAARQQSQIFLLQMQERQIKALSPFLAPACNGSYFGCR